MRNEMRFALCAAAVGCAAFVASADWAEVSESFESGVGSWSGAWGDNNTFIYRGGIGNPIADATHAKYLVLEGDTSYANAADSETGAKRTIDFLMFADELPDEDDELEANEGDQFRLAFDYAGKLKLFCTPSGSDTTNWVEIASGFQSQQWVRVTMNIEYPSSSGKAMAQLVVDGNPCVTEYDYRKADKVNSSGSWYEAASVGTVLAKVDFAGVGGIDDFVLKASGDHPGAIDGGNSTTNGVDYTWIIDNGIADVNTKAAEDSAYTAKQSYDAGIDPYSSTPLYVTNATIDTTLNLAVNGEKGSYTVKRSTSPDMTTPTITTETFTEGVASVDLPTDPATYYYEVATTSGSVVTTNKFGIVAVSNANASVIVSVPWVKVGSGVEDDETPITVDKLVCTKNLTEGDTIHCYNSDTGKYRLWTLDAGVWSPITIVDEGSECEETPRADEVALKRGDGIQLTRKGDTSKPFYLYGQYTVTPVPAKTIAARNKALIANPSLTSPYDFTTLVPGGGTDQIIKVDGGLDVYTHDGTSWGHVKTTVTYKDSPWGQISVGDSQRVTDENTVEPGKGFWYLNNGENDATVNF